MKVRVISRSEEAFTRERSQDVTKVFRNLDPRLHPMERAQEYTRALNAVKLDKIFAKPFIGALSDHRDGVSCMAKNPSRLNCLVSGAMDGDVRLWDLAYRKTVAEFPGHNGAVRGVSISSDGDFLVTCGDDCTARLWELPAAEIGEVSGGVKHCEPVMVFQDKNSFRAVDHQWEKKVFATAGANVSVWDYNRSEAMTSFSWGSETVVSVKFDPAEPDVFVTTGSDRSICLYDLRMNTPLRKLVMQTRTNAVAWNPREPFNFTAANEDCNCYTYDMRKLKFAKCIHKDHVSAVMDVDFSPTGREFVTGSYDRTVRIFSYNGGHSREIYHTKRMQRVFSVRFSGDATYVMSGSDDTNIRLWKAKASEQLGVLLPRERAKHEYLDAVKQRYKHLDEVKRIDRHRQLPKAVFKAKKLRQEMTEAARKKESRKRAHSAPGSMPREAARKKRIVAELE
ncbi:hypothetical protein SELMODRAFT_439559 [Selaginella moellendorffii]|uniref:DDB1- and CUL4-associated factor 13 n=1 Tax=Selaginella moellendorffii TaxID=88036 RepID=D8R5Z0_SELML|nr:DDB1- and CUL4-associated factor 13 [Selaginella moellendorffii]XP_002982384.1 DDB1- and CUL4-associated factor 13 [Selaginella moellendorffii]EFJ16629.1 hypothetical protein SELMODRAFT_116315 [Selaginella moellendorffii]EFJ32570.1 hypothetical protein SELMODRAFT_439559 [Selaginella moellendorffii]|eukprot:XP_002966543.1 DDB1- and CUL4-associated factor 13 [Selaginella moellendorffii]